MNLRARAHIQSAFVVVTSFCIPAAWAQGAPAAYPTKPVRIVVPFSAGASSDTVARLLAQRLSETWGQQFIVDNRAGAGGALGAELVARAQPDGYTLLITNPGPNLNAILLRRKPSYGFRDFSPVVYIGSSPLILVVQPKLPASNVQELIAYAKANPGKVTIGSSGVNSNPHAALEVLKAVTGLNAVHVPYKGSGPALTDTLGGQIHGLYTTTVTAEAAIRAGRAKVLAVAGPRRSPIVPEVPTLSEQGIKGADNLLWMGMVSAAKVPVEIVRQLNRELNRLLQTPDIRQRFDQLGLDVEGGTPEQFAAFIETQAKQLSALIAAGTLQPE
ncbi:MAG: tripartite tricarboxylate transporter substrate binding protein [Burkholderiales bacterium]|nr:tripartite tricarboxylate transporter substrate binding protein [Burkholderiales bacterium]